MSARTAALATACILQVCCAREGTERGPCYGNHTCNDDLVCLSDLCVRPPKEVPSPSSEPVATAERSGKIKRIDVITRRTGKTLKTFPAKEGMAESVSLEFGTFFTDLDVIIPDTKPDLVQIDAQYRTVFSISDEGPRINLDGWKSSTSEWMPLSKRARQGSVSFSLQEYPKNLPFPQFTPAELTAELERRGAHEWIRRLKESSYVGKGPAIDRVDLRVSTMTGAGWKSLGTLTIKPNLEE